MSQEQKSGPSWTMISSETVGIPAKIAAVAHEAHQSDGCGCQGGRKYQTGAEKS
jgi:hypothetical protein